MGSEMCIRDRGCSVHFESDVMLLDGTFLHSFLFSQCTYINGSPQNTFVPGCIELAQQKGVFLGGDDFKSGQTKVKSVLVDLLVSAGIKVCRCDTLLLLLLVGHTLG